MATALGWSQSHVSRLERLVQIDEVSVVELAELAGMLGLELGAGLYPIGDGLVDRGHQALLSRFRHLMSPSIQITSEVPLLRAGLRSWDLLLRMAGQLVGVEAETRIRDAQELVRRIRIRERDGGADLILIVLSDSRHNREAVDELRQMLGANYITSPRRILAALRSGQTLPGSGVVLV
jgi:hypothetical protein